jgi:hypothetical protein
MQGKGAFVILPLVRRLALILVTATVAGVATSSTTAMTTHAKLRLGDEAQMTFRGSGFRPGERVKVTVVAGRRAVHWATTGTRGGFVVRFQGLYVNGCEGISAIAVGNRGSRAAFKRAPGECPNS